MFEIAAHHTICSEAVKTDDEWTEMCIQFGYDINGKHNGVFLPTKMSLACQIIVALHVSNHSAGHGDEPHIAYPDAVYDKIKPILDKALAGGFCDDPEGGLTEAMSEISIDILANINLFTWTITRDGEDYDSTSSVGCANLTSLKDKPSQNHCAAKRKHGQKHNDTVISAKTLDLQIGT